MTMTLRFHGSAAMLPVKFVKSTPRPFGATVITWRIQADMQTDASENDLRQTPSAVREQNTICRPKINAHTTISH